MTMTSSEGPHEDTAEVGPTVTIVVVPRERFSHASRSLESIYRNTEQPFELIYIDGNSPAHVAEYLRNASIKWGFQLVREERFLAPNTARNLGLRRVNSEFVVFVDNDCEVEPGWLSSLLRCAKETRAWAVAPLYFQGARADGVIHMAGGSARIVERDGTRTFKSNHALAQQRLCDVVGELCRVETELFEFHCVLLDMEVIRRLGPLDERYMSAHEHEDLSLLIRDAGHSIYLEPTAQVTYSFGLLDRFDSKYAMLRWSDEWNRLSTQHFREKWQLCADWGEDTIAWCNEHRVQLMRHTDTVPNLIRTRLKGAITKRLRPRGRP